MTRLLRMLRRNILGPLASQLRRNPSRSTLLGGSVVAALMLAIFAATLLRERQDGYLHAQQQADNLALVAERDIERNLELYSLSLQAMVDGWNRPDIMSLPEDLRRVVLFDRSIDASNITSAAIVDENGRIAANLKNSALIGRDLSGRAYFLLHKASADGRIQISAPFLSQLDGVSTIVALSRRITGPGGAFGGVAVLYLDVNYFRHLLQGLDIGHDGRTTVFDPRGTVLMSLPYQEGLVGRDRSQTRLFKSVAAADNGHFYIESPVDQRQRLIVFRTVAGAGIKVLVAPSISDIAAVWNRRALTIGMAAGVLALALVGAATLLGYELQARQRAEARLAEQERRRAATEKRLRAITDNLPVLIAYIDGEQRFRFANDTYRSWLGQDPAALLGRTVADCAQSTMPWLQPDEVANALAGERVEFESVGTAVCVTRTLQSTYIPDVDADGSVLGAYMLSVDVSELKRVQFRLSELARLDALTALPNRLSFRETLPQALARARRSGQGLALMFLDIDRFKSINDTLGHAAGDAALAEFARRLCAAVRTTDTVARWAGDEFLVLLEPVAGPDAAGDVAEKVRQHIAGLPFVLEEQQLPLSTSIGIVWHPPQAPAADAADLLARADAALYQAKAKGRNRFEFAE